MSFDFSTPYASTRLPLFARNIVSTSHPLAARAGLRIMIKDGNAIDADIGEWHPKSDFHLITFYKADS